MVGSRQGALSWELRAATSLVLPWRDQGRSVEGMARLQPVYGRLTEGFETADLKAAKALLDALARPGGGGVTKPPRANQPSDGEDSDHEVAEYCVITCHPKVER